MNETEVLDKVRNVLADIHMETPLETIVARGRARRHRRRAGVAAACVAASVALGLIGVGAAQSGDSAPTAGTGVAPSGGTGPAVGPTTAHLAAFTVTGGPDGTTALTLRKGDRLDPDGLRQALADHGIAALVSIDKMCDTIPQSQPGGAAVRPHPAGLDQVLSYRTGSDGADYLTINPTAMPAGTELSIGYFPNVVRLALIEASAPLSCSTAPGAASPSDSTAAGNNAVHVPSSAAKP